MSKSSPTKLALGVVALVLVGGAAYFAYPYLSGKPDQLAAQAVRSCRRDSKKTTCYQKILSQDLASAGPAHALATLQAVAATDPDVDRDSHVYAHGIWIEAYHLDTIVANTLPTCTTLFSSGCYHGVIQAYLEHQSSVDATTLDGLCRSFRGTDSRWLLF